MNITQRALLINLAFFIYRLNNQYLKISWNYTKSIGKSVKNPSFSCLSVLCKEF